MNSPPPYFKFFPRDWNDSPTVMAMTLEERGLYITCLAMQWTNGGVPDDPVMVARYARTHVRTVRRSWPKVRLALVELKTGLLAHPKLKKLRENSRLPQGKPEVTSGSPGGNLEVTRSFVAATPLECNTRARASESVSVSVSVSEKKEEEDSRKLEAAKQLAKPETGVEKIARAMYAVHPKKKNRVLAEQQVVEIYNRGEDLREIAFIHSLWCRTKDWTEANGRFCRPLDQWLADEGYEQIPDGFESEWDEFKNAKPNRTKAAV